MPEALLEVQGLGHFALPVVFESILKNPKMHGSVILFNLVCVWKGADSTVFDELVRKLGNQVIVCFFS